MTFSMTINGKRVQAHDGDVVLGVAQRAGIHIPTLCHHEAVEPFGSCRLCMVEVTKPAWDGWKGMMAACLYPAAPDLIIETNSERVRRARKTILELLLARCPDSALIQRLAAEYGVESTNHYVTRDNPDLCILCGLCVRICETSATTAISTIRRGHEREIGTPFGETPPDCIGCLACANVCPTGHIKVHEAGFARRIWNKAFEILRCESCGRPTGMTPEQVEFLAQRQNMDRQYLSTCASCRRKETAVTMGRLARWNKLGMTQEEQP